MLVLPTAANVLLCRGGRWRASRSFPSMFGPSLLPSSALYVSQPLVDVCSPDASAPVRCVKNDCAERHPEAFFVFDELLAARLAARLAAHLAARLAARLAVFQALLAALRLRMADASVKKIVTLQLVELIAAQLARWRGSQPAVTSSSS